MAEGETLPMTLDPAAAGTRPKLVREAKAL
jgi:hypothetical protein